MAFDLVFAFDEVVSLGYKEKVTLAQIRTFIEMDSHEERIHELVESNKMKEVKAEAKRKQKEIRKAGKMQGMGGGGAGAGASSLAGIGAGSVLGSSSGKGIGSAGMGSGGSGSSDPYLVTKKESTKKAAEQRRRGTSGMKLGGKAGGKKDSFLEHLMEEGDIEADEYAAALAPTSVAAATAEDAAASLPQVKQEAVHVAIEERLSAVLSNDGGLQSLDVTGEFRLMVRDAAFDKVRIATTHSDPSALQFKTHPNVDKKRFLSDGVIATKNPDRGYPVGTALGVVKWRLSSTDDSLLPLSVSCWPSPGADNTIVNCEYELLDKARELRGVLVRIPLPGGAVPVVGELDGSHSFDHKAEVLLWQLDVVDADSADGTLEFTLPFVADAATLFPIEVTFASAKTFSTIAIESVTLPDESEVKYSEQRSLAVDKYVVEQ